MQNEAKKIISLGVLSIAGLIFLSMSSQAIADDAGKKIYDTKCAGCHGADGKGKEAMAKVFKISPSELNLTSAEAAAMKDEDLLKVIADGKNKMPAYGKQLSAEQQKSVAEYVKSFSGKGDAKPAEAKPEAKAPAAAGSDAAMKEYAKSCAACHSKDGKGNAAMANVFKVNADALSLVDDATLAKTDDELFKITSDGLNKMPGYKGKISDGMIRELVVYFRSLKAAK